MPLTTLLKSAAGTCRHCRRKAGVVARAHRECQATFDAGWSEMVALAANTARTHDFDERILRLALAEVAVLSYGSGATVNEALEEGWKRGVVHAMADGIVTQQEEDLLRQFRDRLALDSAGADQEVIAALGEGRPRPAHARRPACGAGDPGRRHPPNLNFAIV